MNKKEILAYVLLPGLIILMFSACIEIGYGRFEDFYTGTLNLAYSNGQESDLYCELTVSHESKDTLKAYGLDQVIYMIMDGREFEITNSADSIGTDSLFVLSGNGRFSGRKLELSFERQTLFADSVVLTTYYSGELKDVVLYD